jgi:hypothetical protein
MKLKVSQFDDVPETIDDVASWNLGTRETIVIYRTNGSTIMFNSVAWLRVEEIQEAGDR